MFTTTLFFIGSLAVLLVAANYFTQAAVRIGLALGLSPFVVGVFIVGIGTSLPELVSAIIATREGVSEIVSGNIVGASISNLLLITGVVGVLARPDVRLGSQYILIDLHYLIGAFFLFWMIGKDGTINFTEAMFGGAVFLIYTIYLIRAGSIGDKDPSSTSEGVTRKPLTQDILILLLAGLGIYFGADGTVGAISTFATMLELPPSLIALTVLSLGTTLPELAVNITAIRQGKAEMAVGNVLGSSIFNILMVPVAATLFGPISLPETLLSFGLPVMLGSGLFFYLLTLDKRISRWEGWLFILLYALFIQQLAQGT